MLRYFGRLQAQDFKVCGSAFRPPLQEMGFRGGFSSIRLSKPHLLFPLPHFHTFAFLLPLKAPPPVLFVQNLLPWPPTFSLPAFHLPPLSSPTSTLPPTTAAPSSVIQLFVECCSRQSKAGNQLEPYTLLGGSWDLVSKVISTLIGVISIVTLIITLVTRSQDPLSKLYKTPKH